LLGRKEKSGAINNSTTISISSGYPQYSAAAVQALQLRLANNPRRLCGVLASIRYPFNGGMFMGLLPHNRKKIVFF
jgi:hypothetical protein